MDDVYEVGLFGLFLIKALVGAVAGGLIMGALDALSHIFLGWKGYKKAIPVGAGSELCFRTIRTMARYIS